jgi:hypothetical protein
MQTGKKLSIAAIAVTAVVILGLAAFLAFKGHKNKQDETAIVAAVGDATLLLREVLGAQGAPDAVARLDAHLQRIKAAERTPLADNVANYVAVAREIVLRRADATRRTREALLARQLLSAHLAASGRRGDIWFRRAGELKKRMEDAHFEARAALETLDALLMLMQSSRKFLMPPGQPALVSEDVLGAARQQVREELKRSAAELERARRIPT